MSKVIFSRPMSPRCAVRGWFGWVVCDSLRGLWHIRRTLVVVTAVYAFVLLLLLPFVCTNLPYCKLYRNRIGDFSNALNYNSIRTKNAENFIQTLDPAKTKALYEQHEDTCCPRFAIGVITTKRGSSGGKDKPMYLTQVMARLHEVLTANDAIPKTALFMCNVDPYHKTHKEFQALTTLFPYRIKYIRSSFIFEAKHEKEKLDYMFCLREALDFQPKYVILVEDDALPHLDFYQVLEHVLRTKLETTIKAGELVENDEEWLWLKLNFPDNLSFFERNWYFAIEWVALSLFVSGSFTLALHIVYQCRLRNDVEENRGYHGSWLYLVFAFSFLLVFACLVILERPYFTYLRSYSKHFYSLGPGTSCCTPAVLFPAGQAPYVIGFLKHTHCNSQYPLDFALENYRLQRGLRQYLISPNIFRHIGMYSALRGKYNEREASKYLFEE
ncbi:post-GPI attachment to proteins factor 4-like [Apostichopus japonicus]|uniref:post-GPI attachment to proteins factor 4-like n=1 Tax=Stichopus japonicus TaxID=307972 RepID=UPI003AB3197C